MPISLHFAGLVAAEAVTLGPAQEFRITGNSMRMDSGSAVVAELVRHQWKVGTRYFSRYACQGAATVSFAEPAMAQNFELATTSLHASVFQAPSASPLSHVVQPRAIFDDIHASDGMLYAGGKLAAQFVETKKRWHSCEHEVAWPVLIIAAADEMP